MSASLILRFTKAVPFAEILRQTRTNLLHLLNVKSLPSLISQLPPRPQGSATTLEGGLVDSNFPGAYIRFQDDEESTVSIQVFEGGPGAKELMVGVGTVSRPASEVLAAAVAAATARLMGKTIMGDYGHVWVAKDDCTPEELFDVLALQEPQSDFRQAVQLVHKRQARHRKIH